LGELTTNLHHIRIIITPSHSLTFYTHALIVLKEYGIQTGDFKWSAKRSRVHSELIFIPKTDWYCFLIANTSNYEGFCPGLCQVIIKTLEIVRNDVNKVLKIVVPFLWIGGKCKGMGMAYEHC
jgi:hypothetical protein